MYWLKYIWIIGLITSSCALQNSPKINQTRVNQTNTETVQTPENRTNGDEQFPINRTHLVVEFYKNISEIKTRKIMDGLEHTYQPYANNQDDDSYQNPHQFNGIGQKYLITFMGEKEQAHFIKKTQFVPEIFRLWDEQSNKNYTYIHNKAWVVVFKQKVTEVEGEKILQKGNLTFYAGMDASKGKKYFYATGPKFIVNFATASQARLFLKEYQHTPQIHEIYQADWGILKD